MSVSFSSQLFYKCFVSSEKPAQQQIKLTQLISDALPCVVFKFFFIICFSFVTRHLVLRDTVVSLSAIFVDVVVVVGDVTSAPHNHRDWRRCLFAAQKFGKKATTIQKINNV